MEMARPLLPECFWAEIAPLLPPEHNEPKGGRPRTSRRAALTGILVVLRSGTSWELLPPGDWLRFGDDLLAALARLAQGRSVGPPATRAARPARPPGRHRFQSSFPQQRLDRRRKGGAATGPNPTNRGKLGTNRHMLTDAKGIPLALKLTGANVHDSRMLEALVDAVPPIRSCRGQPRKRPSRLRADKVYDRCRCHQALTRRRIQHRIAPGAGLRPASCWDVTGGSSSGPWLGSPCSVASPSATSDGPTSISHSRRWLPP